MLARADYPPRGDHREAIVSARAPERHSTSHTRPHGRPAPAGVQARTGSAVRAGGRAVLAAQQRRVIRVPARTSSAASRDAVSGAPHAGHPGLRESVRPRIARGSRGRRRSVASTSNASTCQHRATVRSTVVHARMLAVACRDRGAQPWLLYAPFGCISNVRRSPRVELALRSARASRLLVAAWSGLLSPDGASRGATRSALIDHRLPLFAYITEGQGFEPWVRGLPAQRFSRPSHSTALPPLPRL